jgi:D-beta-D-heptose 7-phosphate kinase/D-beta-D-heptose 1-phosphate adenosyltransferase
MTNVFLAGDYIIDEYITVNPKRLSPEAPVLIVEKLNTYSRPGGAANVKNNLESFGLNVDFYWGMGTSTKTRIVAQGRQLLRMDRDCIIEHKIPEEIKSRMEAADIILISDYDKGVINDEFISLLSGVNKNILVDPYIGKFDYGENVTLMTPNREEVESITNIKIKNSPSLKEAAYVYIDKTGTENLLITLGKDGMAFFDRENYSESPFMVDAQNGDAKDVTGAGDVVFAVMGYVWSHPHFSKRGSVEYANKAGGLSVGWFGCATLKKEEIFSDV